VSNHIDDPSSGQPKTPPSPILPPVSDVAAALAAPLVGHSPSPWKIGEINYPSDGIPDSLAVWPANAEPGRRSRAICVLSALARLDEQDVANARLIVAAPDLLFHAKAILYDGNLEGLVVGAEQAGVPFNYKKLSAIIDGMLAAITKAEGAEEASRD